MNRNLVDYAGILTYARGSNSGYRLTVELERDFGRYYHSLIPKYKNTKPQKYNSHISVIRHEIPPNLEAWEKYQGESVGFKYDTIIRNGEVYYWLDVVSKELEDIRAELGLFRPPLYPELVPDGYVNLFHITIGNIK